MCDVHLYAMNVCYVAWTGAVCWGKEGKGPGETGGEQSGMYNYKTVVCIMILLSLSNHTMAGVVPPIT